MTGWGKTMVDRGCPLDAGERYLEICWPSVAAQHRRGLPGQPDRHRRDDLDSLGRRWNGAYSGQGRRSRYRIYTPVVIGKLEGDGLAIRIGDFFRASVAAARIGRKEMTGQKKRGD